ncbi:venom acid phosphatase Acph-1-like [Anthonomus grandis grandis]|uniref:venom acid phosphatase Acph-1-like n=1 Tax=Anthonomus grandis grandis TaxID=2921223 RepID=UPI0021650F84|nr:venom acid phosphatase Acph-1-like [Anthonomus grandis grandis]XP_050293015.1 venom acid phosphatase Acph-1-like [Anthonomus grandis grandis]XP_050293016.1 venom acid phosphatase Acph-1-like [Anthonomus grandis grandis]
MNFWLLVMFFALSWNDSQAFPMRLHYANESTLELVHVLYRHGDRTPETTTLYPSNPYYAESNYYPYGYGQLTNEGKLREYQLGIALRNRYINFLGKNFNMSIIDVRSTDYNRTKMSSELLTAGLWPPSCLNIWNPVLHWQPIPYNYEKIADDKELVSYIGCTRFNEAFDKAVEEPGIKNYLSSRYNETLEILVNNTGYSREEMTYLKAFLLYFGFLIQEELNLPLEEWTSAVYPEPLHSLAIDYYYLETNTTELRTIFSGYFMKKIISDTQNKINGESNYKHKKMFLYAAHETNIAGLLLSINAHKITEVPPYGSYVLMEVHKIDDVYGMKLFYQDYTEDEPKLLKIDGCDEFCPITEFTAILQSIIPSSDEECYGNTMKK